MTEKLSATMRIAKRIYALAETQNDSSTTPTSRAPPRAFGSAPSLYPMKTPRHPKALKYLHRFRENEFSEVSQRIGELEEEHERGAAWEVWVLGYVATQRSNDIEPGTLWLGRPNLEVINRLELDPKGKDFGIDGGWINRQFGTDDVFNAKFKRDQGKLNYGADDLAHLFSSAHSAHISGKYIISNVSGHSKPATKGRN
jgi:hypothetical protein